MRPEDKLLLVCARQKFLKNHQQAVLNLCHREVIKWDIVFSTARRHGVAPLIYVNLQQCNLPDLGIPQDIIEQFECSLRQNINTKQRMAAKLRQGLAFFNGKSIDVMLIKGAVLDILVYEQPWYTVLLDADLVTRFGKEQLSEHDQMEFVTFFHHSQIEFDYFEHHDITMNNILPVNFHQIWNDATKIKFGQEDVFIMSPEDMLLSLCINACRKRFFRLKSLCDIAEMINKYPNLNWEDLILKAKVYDCHYIIYTALLVTKITVGCKLPDRVLNKLAVSPIKAIIIRCLVHFLSRYASLATLYPFSVGNMLGRKVHFSLILPYITLRWYQLWRKLRFSVMYTKNGLPRRIELWPLTK